MWGLVYEYVRSFGISTTAQYCNSDCILMCVHIEWMPTHTLHTWHIQWPIVMKLFLKEFLCTCRCRWVQEDAIRTPIHNIHFVA